MSYMDDRDYFSMRAQKARVQASRTERLESRLIHLELAERYEQRVAAIHGAPILRVA